MLGGWSWLRVWVGFLRFRKKGVKDRIGIVFLIIDDWSIIQLEREQLSYRFIDCWLLISWICSLKLGREQCRELGYLKSSGERFGFSGRFLATSRLSRVLAHFARRTVWHIQNHQLKHHERTWGKHCWSQTWIHQYSKWLPPATLNNLNGFCES